MISRKYNKKSNVIGDNIRTLREAKGLSRQDLSNKLMMLGIDINGDGIYKIENSKRIVKDFELSALSIILGVSETEILQDFRNEITAD